MKDFTGKFFAMHCGFLCFLKYIGSSCINSKSEYKERVIGMNSCLLKIVAIKQQ